jgi:hypothetical protein
MRYHLLFFTTVVVAKNLVDNVNGREMGGNDDWDYEGSPEHDDLQPPPEHKGQFLLSDHVQGLWDNSDSNR